MKAKVVIMRPLVSLVTYFIVVIILLVISLSHYIGKHLAKRWKVVNKGLKGSFICPRVYC